ncbi:hypothetical protein N2152v2_000014 [Parachlorella kessleri]
MLCPSNTLGPALLRRPAGLLTTAKAGSANRPCLGRRRRCSGARCSAAPDGSKPRLPPTTPSKEEIKQAILGYSAQEGTAGSALQAASCQQAAGQHASASSLALAQQQQGEAAAEPGSWEDWKQFIDGLDMTLSDILTLQSELSDAVRLEDYRQAAQIKARLEELAKQDIVGEVVEGMDKALEEERYAEAAMLRDAGGVGLLGWWAGRSEEDSTGHVVRVTPEFGRYVATAYTARELADAAGWSREMSLRELLLLGSPDSHAQGGAASAADDEDDFGLPVFELCLRRDSQTGQLEQQPVALFSPVDLEGAMSAVGAGAGDLDDVHSVSSIEGLHGGRVTVEKNEEGEVVSISVEMQTDLSDLGAGLGSDGEDEDGEGGEGSDAAGAMRSLLGGIPEGGVVRLDQMAGFFPGADDPLDLRQYVASGDEISEDDVQQQISDALALQEEEGSAGAAAGSGRDALGGSSSSSSSNGSAGEVSGEEGDGSRTPFDELRDQLMADMQAAAAALSGDLTRDGGSSSSQGAGGPRSSDHGEDDDDISEEEEAGLERFREALAASSGRSGGGGGEGELRFTSVTLQRAPASIEWQGRDAFTIRATAPPAAAAAQQQRGPGPQLAAAADLPGSAAVARARLRGGCEPQQQQQQQAGDLDADGAVDAAQGQQGSSGGEQQAKLQRLEAEVQQWAARRGAKKDQIEAILRATMAAAIAQGIGAVGCEPQPSPVGLEGMCSYRRIPTDHFVKTDAFAGLYLGAFGPHGPELLQLSRLVVDGEEWVHAVKVTGDRNVPAGEVSFRAKVGRQQRLSASESYPLELGVRARYRGQGRVAQEGPGPRGAGGEAAGGPGVWVLVGFGRGSLCRDQVRVAQEGFVHPKWVEGELLLLTPSNPMTHGAELGFVYNMDGVKRFLILFSRIDLDELNL